MQGGSPEMAQGLVELARSIQRGGTTADEIVADSMVSGLQYIASPQDQTPENLHHEVEMLREKLEGIIAQGALPAKEMTASGDARDDLAKAAEEMQQEEPDGSRVTRMLRSASELLTGVAETVQKLGQVGLEMTKLAPIAAALYQIAIKLFGG